MDAPIHTTPAHSRTDAPAETQAPTPAPTPAEQPQLRLPAGRRPVPTPTRLASRRIPVLAYAITGVLLLGGIVGGAMTQGWWQTDCGGANEAAVASGTLTPDGVKGSMTVQQVADGFPGLSTVDVLQFMGAPAGTAASTQLKTVVQDGSQKDVTDLRTWLAQRSTP
jgi:hypothetical protein